MTIDTSTSPGQLDNSRAILIRQLKRSPIHSAAVKDSLAKIIARWEAAETKDGVSVEELQVLLRAIA